jgi:phage shock protein B
MSGLEAIGVPLILFMIFVAPIWVIMHYRTASKKTAGLSQDDQQSLHDLIESADRMEQRIEVLESILDEETPDWRKKYEQ